MPAARKSARSRPAKAKSKEPEVGGFALASAANQKKALEKITHVYHNGARCETDKRGFATPDNRSPEELVLQATHGFIPLWDQEVTLNWRFQQQSLVRFREPESVKRYVRGLLGEALLAWGSAVPVRFSEVDEPWDFEIAVEAEDNCNAVGCTLARAFFPDQGQHELVLFPRMFAQIREEQVETLAHELGHVFGLRHFFAEVSEQAFPVEIFGKHNEISIMNYGADSTLTPTDIEDLGRLYQLAWSGQLKHINETPIRLMRPYSHFREKVVLPPEFALAAAIAG